MRGAAAWARYMNELALQPAFQRGFLEWAHREASADWQHFADKSGLPPTSPDLVLKAAEAASDGILEAARLELDRHVAVIEAKDAIGEL